VSLNEISNEKKGPLIIESKDAVFKIEGEIREIT
jgi:hypothetical protein